MCLSIPGKVVALKGEVATVDYGGERREALTSLIPDIEVGEYVLVSAKMIMQHVPADEAKKNLKLWDETND